MNTPNKFLLLLVVINLICFRCLATVSVTTATGGTGISADKSASANSPSPGYTALGNIVIKTAAAGTDFSTGPQSLTINLPAGWQFNTSTLAAVGAGNISVGTIVVNSNSVTIPYNNSSSNSLNSITLSGIQVQATGGAALASANITATAPTNITGLSGTTNLGSLSQVAGVFVKLQILMPGETAAPGTVSGKTGTPSQQTAGAKIAGNGIIINGVDANWNKASTADNLTLSSNDPSFTSTALALTAGTVTNKNLTLKKASITGYAPSFTVIDASDGLKTSSVTAAFTVLPNTYKQLQIVLPGQAAAPGTATGVTGTATNPSPGVAYGVTVNAVDAYFNLITSVTNSVLVALTPVDAYATIPPPVTLAAGTVSFNITFKAASASRKIVVTDQANTTFKTTSSALVVAAGSFTKILLVLPGETYAAGSTTGKTGTPGAFTAGSSTSVRAYAVDNYFNTVTTVNDAINVTISDGNGVISAAPTFVSGVTPTTGTSPLPLKITFKIATSPGNLAWITATDGSITYTQSNIVVNPGVLKKMLLVFAGSEAYSPSSATGKTGTPPTSVTAGTSFTVNVYGVDAQFNTVSTNDVINLTATNDANATFSGPSNLSSGTATFTATFRTVGLTAQTINKSITVADATTAGITSYTTSTFTVSVGAYSQIQILLPGETSKPGTVNSTTPGKSGTANVTRGVNFTATYNAVDACYNIVTTINNVLNLSMANGNGGGGSSIPTSATYASGVTTTTTTMVSNSNPSPLPTITATDATTGFTATVSIPIPPGNSAITDYFLAVNDGDWSNTATWESSANGTTWHAATLLPTNSATAVNIPSGNTVTVSASTSVGNSGKLTVESGGVLKVTGGTLTIGTKGALISGTLISSATITLGANATLTFDATGKYQHNFTMTVGTIPTATWDDNSTCEIIGYTTFNSTMNGTNQHFGNFIWNCTNQGTGSPTFNGSSASVNNLTIISTGASTGALQLSTGAAGSVTVAVRGNYTQTGGNVNLASNATGTGNINISNKFSMSGGTLKTTGNSLIAFNGSGTAASPQKFNKSGGTISNAVNFAINSGTAVDFGTDVLDGSTGTFTLNSGATLITANDDGISTSPTLSGSIQNTGTRTFNTAANYIYNGTNAQSIGTGFPGTFNNLTVNNSQGLTLPSTTNTYTIASGGALTLTSGNLDLTTNTLALAGTATISGTGFIKTQNTSSAPIPSGKTWSVGIEYNGSGNQTLVAGTYSNLSFSSTGIKTATSGTINVTGNWSSSVGKVDVLSANPTLQFNGTGSSQTLDDDSDSGNGVVFGTVAFGGSGTKTLNSGGFSVAPLGYLTMAGTATLTANGRLTVLSDSTGTGNIGPIPSGTAITGDVNVETFFRGGGDINNRGYRLISSPVYDAASGGTSYNLSFLQGKGSYLTSSLGTSGGFDATGNATLYLYREDKVPDKVNFTSGNFRAITAINGSPLYSINTVDSIVNLGVGNGVMFFFRGNNTTVVTNPPNDITLSSTGPINHGQIVVSPWFTGGSNLSYTASTGTTDPRDGITGYNLVGNPYPCSIDWNTVFNGTATTGIYAPNTDKSIYIYNPKSKTYISYLTTAINAGICSVNTITDGNIIPSGQGFFVRAIDTIPQIIFNESAKVNSHPSVLSLNAAVPVAMRQMNLQLSRDSISKDENAIVFNENAHNNYVVAEDVKYLQGSGVVSLSNLSADNKRLAINQLPLPKSTQVIQLNMVISALGQYKFTVTRLKNIPNIYNIWLVDKFMKDSLDMRTNKDYAFMVSSDAASRSTDRFKLVMKPNPALSVHLLNFAATKNTADVKIIWTAENEADYTQYVLQRSTDGGKTFKVLDSLTSASLASYNDLDPHPVIGNNQYRLKQIDVLGNISYSNIVTVMYSLPVNNSIASSRISLYPNPTANTLNVTVKAANNAVVSGNYKITITSTSGVIIKSATSTQADWHSDVSKLMPGTYFIEVINRKDNNLVGRTSFIKL